MILACVLVIAIDGDTLRCDGARVRLWGIDAPEMAEPGGQESKSALVALIDGQAVTCEQIDTDRYRRIVARCYVDGRDVGGMLVTGGWARDWPRYSGGYYAQP